MPPESDIDEMPLKSDIDEMPPESDIDEMPPKSDLLNNHKIFYPYFLPSTTRHFSHQSAVLGSSVLHILDSVNWSRQTCREQQTDYWMYQLLSCCRRHEKVAETPHVDAG